LSVLPNLDVTASRLALEEGDQIQYGGKPQRIGERSYVWKTGTKNTGLGPAVFEKVLLYRVGEDPTLHETEKEGM